MSEQNFFLGGKGGQWFNQQRARNVPAAIRDEIIVQKNADHHNPERIEPEAGKVRTIEEKLELLFSHGGSNAAQIALMAGAMLSGQLDISPKRHFKRKLDQIAFCGDFCQVHCY